MPHLHSPARLRACTALFGLALSTSAWADVLTVGPACQYGDLQAAIDATHGNVNEIHVHADYRGKPVRITNKTLHIYGGYPSCNAPAPIPFSGNLEDLSWLDGSLDGSAKPVVAIDGQASIDLRNFLIGSGHNDGHNGGGIQFNSSGNFGHLELHAVDVNGNRADKGGGIFFHGGASVNELFLFDYSTIRSNTAHDAGGGIRLEGNTYLLANSPHLSIDHNSADPSNGDDGTGGGIQMLDATSADIGSPGYDIYAPINSNEARLGGGIALLDNAQARFYTTVPGSPARIDSNHAFEDGGGVLLDGTVRLCIAGGGINGNTADRSGGAVWAEDTADSGTLKIGTECNQPPGAITCPQGLPCNTVDGNSSIGAIIGGGTVNGFTLNFDNIALRRNESNLLIDTRPMTFNGQISNCEISSNHVLAVIENAGTERTTLDFCTIASNAIDGVSVFKSFAPLSLVNTIVWQPTKQTFDRTPFGNSRIIDVIAQDAATLAPGQFETFTNVRQIDPLFASDLRLLPSSPAIDYSTSGDRSVDLDFRRRPIDIQDAGPGLYDIGAYEYQQRGTFPPGENFDELGQTPALPSSWQEVHTGDNEGWKITTTGVDTGPYAAYVEDKQGFADLITPNVYIDVPKRLTFRHRVSLGGNTTVDNEAVTLFVYVGSSLYTVTQLGGSFTQGAPNACHGQCWTGDHGAYETVTAELPASLVFQTVRFYWSFGYLGDHPGLAGYWLDSITLESSDSIFFYGFDP